MKHHETWLKLETSKRYADIHQKHQHKESYESWSWNIMIRWNDHERSWSKSQYHQDPPTADCGSCPYNTDPERHPVPCWIYGSLPSSLCHAVAKTARDMGSEWPQWKGGPWPNRWVFLFKALIFRNNKPCNVRHLVGTWCDSLMFSSVLLFFLATYWSYWGNGPLRPNFQPNWC